MLKKLEIVETYCNTKWEYVDGNALMLAGMSTKKPVNYEIKILFDKERPCVHVYSNHGDVMSDVIFDVVCAQPHVFKVEDSEGYIEISETSEANLVINEYLNSSNELVNSLEIRRIAE